MMKRPARLWIGLVFFISSQALAGTHNYRSVLVGERAVGLAGAYVALSDSPEGGYYNPAGLAYVDYATLSISGNLYTFQRGKQESALKFEGDTEDLSLDSFQTIPQIAAFTKNFRFPWEASDGQKKNTVAFSFVVTDQTVLGGRVDFDVASGQALLSRNISDSTILVGPSYARRLSDRLSLGGSVFISRRSFQSTAFIYDSTTAQLGQGYLEDERKILNLVGLVGLRYGLSENVWLGLTYQTPSLKLNSSGSFLLSSVSVDNATSQLDQTFNDQPSTHPNDELPQRLTLGAAYQKKGKWAISSDVLFYLPNEFPVSKENSTSRIKQNFVTNFSVGGEYFVAPIIPIRAGFFTDFSSSPGLSSTGSQFDEINNMGATFTASLEEKNSSVTIGTVITWGGGSGLDNLSNPVHIDTQSYALVLAGSFKF